jgi:hypothetical protein
MAEVVPIANGAAPGSDSSIVPPLASGTAPGASGTAPEASGTATSGTSALSATEPSGDEVGEPIAVDEFQGDILGRKYCVGKTPEGDYFFDYAKPPPGCDLSKIKFFRVTGASMGEVEAELKKLLGTVNTSSSSGNTPVSSTGPTMANMSGRPIEAELPVGLVERSPVTVNWLQTTPKLAAAARIPYTNSSGLRGGNVTRKDKKSRKETSRKQRK